MLDTTSIRATATASDRIAITVLDPVARLLTRAAIPALRVSLGLVFFGFGILKFFPGVSPAEEIVQRTLDVLSFGLIGPTTAVLMTAVMETFIGLTLLTGKLRQVGLLVLAGALVGIMSLLAQYVLKDVVLAAAGIALVAVALGARFERPTH